MSTDQTARERRIANDVAHAEAKWGMPDLSPGLAASPERLAYDARLRGDRTFQVEIVVSVVEGNVDPARGPLTRTRQIDYGYNVVDRIEEQGWRLEQVATSYAITGSLGHRTYAWTAEHGRTSALYVFRRAEQGADVATPAAGV